MLTRPKFLNRSLAVLLSLALVAGSLPINTEAGQPSGPAVAGIASAAVDCLRVEAATTAEAALTLTWQGDAERARLIVRVAGAEAAHSIRLNGKLLAHTPIVPEGSRCGEGQTFYLDVPLSAVVQGENHIELTTDALPSDEWVASDMRIEVLGDLRMPARTANAEAPNSISTAATPFTINISNPYDSTTQQARAQVPDSYNPTTPTPLVIYLHGRYGSMFDGEDYLGDAANTKGWLLASPEMHGAWPPAASPQPPTPGAFAYASLQAQYDVIGTIRRMRELYPNVDTNRIYLAGDSMGGQATVVTAAKFPDVFAAVFDNQGPTNITTWYDEQVAFYGGSNAEQVVWMRRECHSGGVEQTPAQNPFCYQRRSGLNFAGNLIHVPLSITHHLSDTLVPISHSFQLRDAINAAAPDLPVVVGVDTRGSGCGPYFHSCSPDAMAVLNYLQAFTLNNTPQRILATSDETKPFYWLNIEQLNPMPLRFTQVNATVSNAIVTATISDTQTARIGFNVGVAPMPNPAGFSQPGLGLTAPQFQVRIGANPPVIIPYSIGYLTVTVPSGQTSVTVSPYHPVYLPVIRR